jgi:hypothetical protein
VRENAEEIARFEGNGYRTLVRRECYAWF